MSFHAPIQHSTLNTHHWSAKQTVSTLLTVMMVLVLFAAFPLAAFAVDVSVSVAPDSYSDDTIVYTVSIKEAESVATVDLEFTIDGNIAGLGAVGQNGFTAASSDIIWSYAGDGKWKGSATLEYSVGDFSSAASTDIYKASFNVSGVGDATFTLTTVKVNGVNVTIGTAEATTAISMSGAPKITAQPQNISVTEGQSATFSVTASGAAPLTYQWQTYIGAIGRPWGDLREGDMITGTTASTLTFATTVAGSSSQVRYRCVVTNEVGSITSNEVKLTVTAAAKVAPAISGPTTMNLVVGYAATSTGAYAVTGTPAPTVTKTSGDSKITWNDTTQKLDIAAGLTAGKYEVILKAGSTGNPAATLTFTLTVTTAADAVAPPVTPSLTPFPCTDVPVSAWYYSDVKTAWEMGLINGKSATLFAPDDNLTYAEAVKLAACMHQKYIAGAVTLVNGTPNWYDSYVKYAKDNGIINKDYDWNAQATRAGYMEIFANALPDEALGAINIVANGTISDVPSAHPQAAAIYKLYRAGIVQGVDAAHNCNPGSNIRRSEVAAILTRMMNENARISFNI